MALLGNEFWGSSVKKKKKDVWSINCSEDTGIRLCAFTHVLNVT